MTALGKRR